MGFLAEDAYEMAWPLRENGKIVAVADLLRYLDTTYEGPDRKRTAERQLQPLKQGNADFATHYSKFRSIVVVSGWQRDAERSALYRSLSYELREALSKAIPSPNEPLAELVAKVKLLDGQLRLFAAERKPAGRRTSSGSTNPPPPRTTTTRAALYIQQASPRIWAPPQCTCPPNTELRQGKPNLPKGRTRLSAPSAVVAITGAVTGQEPASGRLCQHRPVRHRSCDLRLLYRRRVGKRPV